MRRPNVPHVKSYLLPLTVFIAALIVGVAEFAYRYPKLPDLVASHFDAAGKPNGWMSKREMATTMIVVAAILGFSLGMACVVVSVSPASAFNVPRKDYWTAPEREPVVRRMVLQRLLWFMAATMLLLAYVSHLVLDFNLRGGGRLTAWTPLGFYLAFVAVWCGEMTWAFYQAPREGDAQET